MPRSTKDEAKARQERADFLRCAEKLKLDLDKDSILQPCPPAPDILCSIDKGKVVAFELSVLCHSNIRAFASKSHKRAKATGAFDCESMVFYPDDPTLATVAAKLCKSYEATQEIILLVYSDDVLSTPDDTIEGHIGDLLDARGFGPFGEVWFCGELNNFKWVKPE